MIRSILKVSIFLYFSILLCAPTMRSAEISFKKKSESSSGKFHIFGGNFSQRNLMINQVEKIYQDLQKILDFSENERAISIHLLEKKSPSLQKLIYKLDSENYHFRLNIFGTPSRKNIEYSVLEMLLSEWHLYHFPDARAEFPNWMLEGFFSILRPLSKDRFYADFLLSHPHSFPFLSLFSSQFHSLFDVFLFRTASSAFLKTLLEEKSLISFLSSENLESKSKKYEKKWRIQLAIMSFNSKTSLFSILEVEHFLNQIFPLDSGNQEEAFSKLQKSKWKRGAISQKILHLPPSSFPLHREILSDYVRMLSESNFPTFSEFKKNAERRKEILNIFHLSRKFMHKFLSNSNNLGKKIFSLEESFSFQGESKYCDNPRFMIYLHKANDLLKTQE